MIEINTYHTKFCFQCDSNNKNWLSSAIVIQESIDHTTAFAANELLLEVKVIRYIRLKW